MKDLFALYDDILDEAYAEYLDGVCTCREDPDECQCLTLLAFEKKFLEDREEAKISHLEECI